MNHSYSLKTCLLTTFGLVFCMGSSVTNAQLNVDYPTDAKACILNAQHWASAATARGATNVDASLQKRIAGCLAHGSVTSAQSACVGLVNTDYIGLAQALVANRLTPGDYVYAVQDRSRKMRMCLNNKSWARALIKRDRDSDLVPDNKDRCGDTPAMTPTDDFGCPVSERPYVQTPSAEEVHKLLDRMGLMADAHCANAPPPSIPVAINLTYMSLVHVPSSLELEITTVKNQPTECQLLYEVLIQGERKMGTPQEDAAIVHFVFRQSDDVNMPRLAERLKIRKEFTGPQPISAFSNLHWKVRAMNGNGTASPWSEYSSGSFFIE